MTNLHPSLPHFSSSHPMVFAWLVNRNQAALVVSDLLALGVSWQDLTLIEPGANGHSGQSLASLTMSIPVRERESAIGGGIATSEPDDDVSSAQEMDDSESAAEEYLYPKSGHSYAEEDARDMERLVDPGTEPLRPRRRAVESVSEIAVQGLGTLVGDGSFGTRVLEAVFTGGVSPVRRWLWGESTPGIEGEMCVVAIDAGVESPGADAIEDALTLRGVLLIQRPAGCGTL